MPHREPASRCRLCGYDLAGLRDARCPECGALAGTGRRPRRGWFVVALLVVAYLPYAWLLFGDFDAQRIRWIAMWPVLPGLLVSHVFLMSYQFPVEYAGSGVITAIMLLTLIWLGRFGRWARIVILVVAAVLSILNSWGAYHAFRM